MSDFFHRLSYSFGNEDWMTEQKALKIRPNDRVVCITASGDRPMNLLLSDCGSIISIDVNPIQNALLNLKCASLETLSTEEYLAFMGLASHEERLELYNKVKPHLEQNSSLYWNSQKKALRKGIIFAGAIEKWCLRCARIFRIIRRKKVKQLFDFDNVEEQSEFIKNEWDSSGWRAAFSIILNPAITRFFIKDPGLYENVDGKINIAKYIRHRIQCSLNLHLAKSNPLLSLLFKGKVYPEGLPPYLTRQGAEIMRSRLNRLRWETSDLISYLKAQPANSFDCFSLSDVASYISKEEFTVLSHEILRTARNGARFCIRQFLSGQTFPEGIRSHFHQEQSLEQELEYLDKNFVYRFMVGSIKKI